MSKALGLLETYGYTAAIVGLDAALKAANVTLKEIQKAGGGIVTVMVEGDVDAVSSSISVASDCAKNIGTVRSQHVIARPDIQIKCLWNEQIKVAEKASKNQEEQVEEINQNSEKIEQKVINNKLTMQKEGKQYNITSQNDLLQLKVVELRRIARGLKGFPIETKKIKYANKSQLVNAILAYMKMEVE